MLALISFILVMVGSINWFCIGLLQFDFVAGLFGSQSSIFSRIVYIAVGLGALMLIYNLIENKGKIKFNFKKKLQELTKNENSNRERRTTYYAYPKNATNVEASSDNSTNSKMQASNDHTNIETSKDNSVENKSLYSKQENVNTEASSDMSSDNNNN